MTDYYVFPYTGLTGGGAEALDSLDGALFKEGDAAVVINNASAYFLVGANNSANEASPDVITPDANNSGRRWVRVDPYHSSIAGIQSSLSNKTQVVDRGDPSAWDYTQTSLTTDGTWRDLDLTAITTANANFVMLEIQVKDDAVGMTVAFRKKGHTQGYTVKQVFTQVANQFIQQGLVVPANNGVIQYYGSNTTFANINLIVSGWMI